MFPRSPVHSIYSLMNAANVLPFYCPLHCATLDGDKGFPCEILTNFAPGFKTAEVPAPSSTARISGRTRRSQFCQVKCRERMAQRRVAPPSLHPLRRTGRRNGNGRGSSCRTSGSNRPATCPRHDASARKGTFHSSKE